MGQNRRHILRNNILFWNSYRNDHFCINNDWIICMKIIIDTREQKPLSFTGHDIIREKLSEGDYNVSELREYIVIERKSMQDFYGSIIQQHERFRDEIVRSRLHGKTFYIFLECSLGKVFDYCVKRKFNPLTMGKIIDTMIERYGIIIIECKSRTDMSDKIISTIEINKKLNEVMQWNKK